MDMDSARAGGLFSDTVDHEEGGFIPGLQNSFVGLGIRGESNGVSR